MSSPKHKIRDGMATEKCLTFNKQLLNSNRSQLHLQQHNKLPFTYFVHAHHRCGLRIFRMCIHMIFWSCCMESCSFGPSIQPPNRAEWERSKAISSLLVQIAITLPSNYKVRKIMMSSWLIPCDTVSIYAKNLNRFHFYSCKLNGKMLL